MNILIPSLLLIIAYLLGSLCSAVIVCHIFKLADPRTQGSNNPGATNVLRLHGKKYAALVLVADMLKGSIAVILGYMFSMSSSVLAWIGFASVLGHVFPIYFRFKGGKGVATALGVYFGLNPILGLLSLSIWLISAKVKKYSSLASLITMVLTPIVAINILKTADILLPLYAISLLVIANHRENIERLIRGEESKLKF